MCLIYCSCFVDFCCSKCCIPSLANRRYTFQLVLSSSDTTFVDYGSFFAFPDLVEAISPRNSGSFQQKMVSKDQYVGTKCAYYYWVTQLYQSSQQIKLGNVQIYKKVLLVFLIHDYRCLLNMTTDVHTFVSFPQTQAPVLNIINKTTHLSCIAYTYNLRTISILLTNVLLKTE